MSLDQMESINQTQLIALFILTIVIGFAISIAKNGNVQKAITTLLVVSFVYYQQYADDGLSYFGTLYFGSIAILLVGTATYAVFKKGLSVLERITITSIGLTYHGKFFFKYLYHEFYPIFDLLGITCVILLIYSLIKNKLKIPDEFGFLFIWSMFILLDLLATLFNLRFVYYST